MRILLILLISLSSFAQNKGLFNTSGSKQTAFDQMVATADYVISAMPTTSGSGGVYTDQALTTRATVTGDEVLGFKGFGNNPLSVPNLPFTNTIPPKSTALVWYKDFGNGSNLVPRYVDNGNFDKYVIINNGPLNSAYYETNPGSNSISGAIDIIFGLRYQPHVAYETSAFWKDEGGAVRFNATSGSLIGSQGFSSGIDCVVRLKIDGSGNWTMWKNNVQIGSGTGASFTESEYVVGTGSHAMWHHFRYILIKRGGTGFSSGDLTTIYTNTQICFPWTTPSYPFKTNLWQGGNNAYDNSIGGWRPGYSRTCIFSGGNGTEGTFKYQWYYYDNNDATLFPSSDGTLTNHRQIPCTLNLSTMASGNTISAVMMDGVNIMGSTVTYTTSTSNTAALLVTNINAAQANYMAYQKGSVVQVHIKNNNYRTDVLTATVSGFTPSIVSTNRLPYITTSTYNATGQIYDGHYSDNTIAVMCVIRPFDSAGTEGEPILMEWVTKNF